MVYNMTFLYVVLFAVISSYSMSEPVPYNHIPINNVESAILAISERFRTLDSLMFASQKWDLTLDSHSRKLESLESKISRLETLLDMKIEKIADAQHSKTVKEELAREQLNSKIDKVYERLNHRLSYAESRLENSIGKQKTTLDATLNGITQQLEHLEKSNNEVENDLIEIAANIDDVKSTLLSFNISLSNNTDKEGGSSATNHETMRKVESIGEQFNNFASKVSNIFHDTSVKIKANEDMLKTLLDGFNSVKKELQDANHNLKNLKKQIWPSEHLEFLIDKVENIARENEANYERLDNNIERLHGKQELYQESCHRIQVNELQIESRIGHTLERILDSIDNRTLVTDRNYEEILEILKVHNYAMRICGQCTSAIVKLKEQFTQDFKMLTHDITINDPMQTKIDILINNLKQLHDQFLQFNSTPSCAEFSKSTKKPEVLNSTTLLHYLERLNYGINTVIEKIDQEHRAYTDWPESEDSEKATKKILDIFNATDADLSPRTSKNEMNTSISLEEDEKGMDNQYDLTLPRADDGDALI